MPAIDYKVLLPVLIAVLGWLATHALSLRAQRRAFQNQVLDRARLDLSIRIRAYQNWLSEVYAWIANLSFLRTLRELERPVDTARKAEELLAFRTRKEDQRAWALLLEDYQILFPETRVARQRLDTRHIGIAKGLEPVLSSLMKLSFSQPSLEQLDDVIKQADAVTDLIMNQGALLDDLRIHLQNEALSRIMRRRVPHRQPLDKNVPRLLLTGGGDLDVFDQHGTRLDGEPLWE